MVLLLIVEELRGLQALPAPGLAAGEVVDLDHHHPLCVGIGEWIEQNVIDDAEDGGGGADAEGQRENRNAGKAGLIAQPSGAVGKIPPESSHVLYTVGIADLFRGNLL